MKLVSLLFFYSLSSYGFNFKTCGTYELTGVFSCKKDNMCFFHVNKGTQSEYKFLNKASNAGSIYIGKRVKTLFVVSKLTYEFGGEGKAVPGSIKLLDITHRQYLDTVKLLDQTDCTE